MNKIARRIVCSGWSVDWIIISFSRVLSVRGSLGFLAVYGSLEATLGLVNGGEMSRMMPVVICWVEKISR